MPRVDREERPPEQRPIRVYVGATADMEAEREVIGEALARFPVPLPWRISRTAPAGQQTPESVAAVAYNHFALLVLGADVSAPVGAELLTALEAGVPTLAMVSARPRTLAGTIFWRHSHVAWHPFEDRWSLTRMVHRWLAQRVIDDAIKLGLRPDELAALMRYVEEHEEADMPVISGDGPPQGAQDGAVIVADRRGM